MTTAKVSFEILIPENATPDQVKAWLRYRLNDSSSILNNNPLFNQCLEPVPGSFELDM
jgi:hypothetical protein